MSSPFQHKELSVRKPPHVPDPNSTEYRDDLIERLVRKPPNIAGANSYFGKQRNATHPDGVSEPTKIISGQTGYPRLHGSSPWATPDGVPSEPPLGYAINEMLPVGSAHEVAKSQAGYGANAAPGTEGGSANNPSRSIPLPLSRRRF
jgi:hypothetical protein